MLSKLRTDALSKSDIAVAEIRKRYPGLDEHEAREIHQMVVTAYSEHKDSTSLVVTAPPNFAIRSKVTKVVVENMLKNASKSILITGYSLSDYFDDLVDIIIKKSQQGVFVQFYVNHIESQQHFAKVNNNKSHFLRIYNYPEQDDSMSALHAKVISVDDEHTLITSANLSYHGQQGNIELGTFISSTNIAKQVKEIFTQLVTSKVFQELK